MTVVYDTEGMMKEVEEINEIVSTLRDKIYDLHNRASKIELKRVDESTLQENYIPTSKSYTEEHHYIGERDRF